VYYALKFIHDRQAAEDVVIDSFIKFTDRSCDDKNVRHMLYVAVKNSCIDHLRSLERHATINRIPLPEDIPYEMLEANVLKLLTAAMEKLPSESKQVIDLYYMQEKTCIEIGHLLHKPAATIRSIKRYALNKLFALMK
jgi:RNA polymerase sigma-70 factor (ECF subfamily)